MSASYPSRNKLLYERIHTLEDKLNDMKAENKRLVRLIPQAWNAAQKRLVPSSVAPPSLKEWMESKGLA